jgi:tetratricopeptide (TPR) repeat protein
MVKEWRHAATACLMVVLGAGVVPANAEDSAKPTQNLTLASDTPQSQADLKEVLDAVAQIGAGKIQQAIDGPLTDVVNRYEKRYANSRDVVFSARGTMQGFLYLSAAAAGHVSKGSGNAIDVGPAWAMAYWGRGYGYSDMNRYPEAEVELKKALALSPRDAQYTSELAYVYQRQKRYNESLALYLSVPDLLDTMDGWSEAAKTEYRCKALRGQGYDLVELKRYDEAEAAYNACVVLIPGEPKSLGELEYIKGVRAKGGVKNNP